jgi:hypothetical protein
MKKIVILGLALALVGGVAYANFCARDNVPAATLLVPYAVVDISPLTGTPDPAGFTTLFAVTNVSSSAEIVHFTVWDAISEHIVDWDELLTGYDVWTINFRDLLTGSFNIFDTGSAQLKPVPVGGPPPYGPTSNAGFTTPLTVPQDPKPPVAGCAFPYGALPSLGPIITSELQAAIVAQKVQDTSDCSTSTPGNPPWLANLSSANRVFFYVTADVVHYCSTSFPDQTAYWTSTGTDVFTTAPFTGYPADRNVLVGDVIYVNFTTNYSESIPAVALEAAPQAKDSGLNTFYGRYSSTNDDREPLATAFAFRYINSGASTQVMVWKDHSEIELDKTLSPTDTTYACAPYVYYAFDEAENALARGIGPSGFNVVQPNVIPFETQSAPLDSADWGGLPAANGWMMLVFDPSIPFNGGISTVHQAWVGVRYLSAGYSTSLEAATLANVNCFTNQVLPGLGINTDSWNGGFPTTYPYLP